MATCLSTSPAPAKHLSWNCISRFLDPILVILANQEFMLLFYLAVPAVAWAAIKRPFAGIGGKLLVLFGLAGLVWFICLFLQIGMTLLPRYYLLPTVTLIMAFAAWLRLILWRRSPNLVVVLLVTMFVSHLVGIYVDNRNPIFGERSLVEFLRQTDQPVRTDPETALRGDFLYNIAGVRDRVVAGPPEPGQLYFYNPWYVEHLAMAPDRKKQLERLAPYRPREDWPVVWHKAAERRIIGDIIDGLGLTNLLPKEIYRRLVQPNFPVTVYRPHP
jgi:hypothetical protein